MWLQNASFSVKYLLCLSQPFTVVTVFCTNGEAWKEKKEVAVISKLQQMRREGWPSKRREIQLFQRIIWSNFFRRTGILVHGSTVQRSLAAARIKKELPKTVPEMTAVRHEKRRDFAVSCRITSFRTFSCQTNVFSSCTGISFKFGKSSQERSYKGVPKFCPKVMV